MELYTIGYEGRTLPQFIDLLKESGIQRLVDVRERPLSRKKGFSKTPLSEALGEVGIAYETVRELGNPIEIRDLWKDGELPEGKRRYRSLLENGRSKHVEYVLELAEAEVVALMCFENDPDTCHRTIIAEEAVRHESSVVVQPL